MRTLFLLVAIVATLATLGLWVYAIRHMRPDAPRWKAFASWTVGNAELYDATGRRAILHTNWTGLLAFAALVAYWSTR